MQFKKGTTPFVIVPFSDLLEFFEHLFEGFGVEL